MLRLICNKKKTLTIALSCGHFYSVQTLFVLWRQVVKESRNRLICQRQFRIKDARPVYLGLTYDQPQSSI